MGSTPDTTQCPVCGEPYATRIVVQRGDHWSDLFPGQPLAFFRRYRRRCTARYDVVAETRVAEDERVVYFHDPETSATVF